MHDELLIFALAGLACACLYWGVYCWRGPSLGKTIIKTAAIALPALGVTLAGAPWLAVAGLWACALGDYLLSRTGEATLKAGIGAFALGHVLYVVAFLASFGWGAGPDGVTVGVVASLVLLGLSTEIWLTSRTGGLRAAARVYVGLILTMGAVAALPSMPRETVLVGALLFIASDLILSLDLFVLAGGWFHRLTPFLIWPLYAVAQVFIITGFVRI